MKTMVRRVAPGAVELGAIFKDVSVAGSQRIQQILRSSGPASPSLHA
jgi:hypothetical protein